MTIKVCSSCKKVMRFEQMYCPSCGAEYKKSTPKWMIAIALLIALAVGVVVGMPKQSPPSPEKTAQVKAIEKQTQSRLALQCYLKEPVSAQIRNHKGNCVEVNSKNSFGGYTGFKRFIASPTIVATRGGYGFR